MFTIQATIGTRPVRITWDHGVLTGDEQAIEWVRNQAKHTDEIGYPTCQQWSGDAMLANAVPAFLLMEQALGTVEVVEGEVPKADESEPGAIH